MATSRCSGEGVRLLVILMIRICIQSWVNMDKLLNHSFTFLFYLFCRDDILNVGIGLTEKDYLWAAQLVVQARESLLK